MNSSRLVLRFLAGSLLALCLCSATALAAPVTVQLRVEGSAKTLFEGPIQTEGETFTTASGGGLHPCDYSDNGNAGSEFSNGGNSSATPTTALHDAAVATGLAFDAEWFGTGEKNENPGDYFVSQVGPDINSSSMFWGFAVNNLTAPVGGCQIALAPGSEVLWAYNYFSLEHRLKLAGPPTASVGAPITVHVTDGQTGSPVAGMAVGQMVDGVTTTIPGSPLTDGQGNATLALPQTGNITLKAQGGSAVRSNGIAVCVHNGNDGTCQTTVPAATKDSPPVADSAKVTGITNGRVFARRFAPRLLRGEVKVSPGGTLRDVRISLHRQAGKRCFLFNGTRGRFVRSGCAAKGFFSVGGSLSFSYLLPARLPAGRYVYEIEAVDAAGHVSALSSGSSHVVFRVR